MDKYLWRFHWDCGRQGEVEGLFVATEEEIKNAIGEEVNFGEILGKHSEIYGPIEEGEITKVDLDSETVNKVTEILGYTWSGYDPLRFIKHECSVCGDIYNGDDMELIDGKWICYHCDLKNS